MKKTLSEVFNIKSGIKTINNVEDYNVFKDKALPVIITYIDNTTNTDNAETSIAT